MDFLKSLSSRYPTVADVSLKTFRNNIKEVKSYARDVKILGVVKTNAYGHGLVEMSKAAIEAGVDRLGTTSVEEGKLLRDNGVNLPIQLLCSIIPEQAEDIVQYDLTASVSTEVFMHRLSEEAVKQEKDAFVHLKIDTGLHRFGVQPEEASKFCERCYHLPNIKWEGIYTHFSDADEGNWKKTEHQYFLFMQTINDLEAKGYSFPIHHVGGSTITIERPDMYLDMIRPGVLLYGYPPDKRQQDKIKVNPVLKLSTKILQIRTLKQGTPVGYGGSYVTKGEETLAVLPIGHGDGYQRALSNRAEVLVKGKRAEVVGTISLDQTIINITNIPNVEIGEEVVLIGEMGGDVITGQDVAGWMDSIVDEVLASLMDRIPRKYHEE